MTTDDQKIQKEFTEAERAHVKTRQKLRESSGHNAEKVALEEYNKTHEKLMNVKRKLAGGTILFSETFYFMECGQCGYEAGAYYEKLPEEYECEICGKITQVVHEISRRPTFYDGRMW